MAQVRRVLATAPYLAFTSPEAEEFFRTLAGETFSLVPVHTQIPASWLNQIEI